MLRLELPTMILSKAMTLLIALAATATLAVAQETSVLNEDGSVNSALNRAARGQTVQLLLVSACTERTASHSKHAKPEAPASSSQPAPASSTEVIVPRVIMNVQAAEVVSSSVSPEQPGIWKVVARVPTPNDGEEPLRDETPYIVFLDGATKTLGNLWVEP